MVGVTRIYGQQWACYYTDVNHLFSNITSRAKPESTSVDMPLQKMPKEAITLVQKTEIDIATLPFEFEELNLDFDLTTLTKTPEQARKSISASSVSRGKQSIDVARGSMSKGSLTGTEDANQFAANDNDASYFGFGPADDYDFFLPSGPEETLESFVRGITSGSSGSQQVLDQVLPDIELAPLPKLKPTSFKKLFDEETMLSKDELLLADGEGLANEGEVKSNVASLNEILTNPLIGLNVSETIWSSSASIEKSARKTIKSKVNFSSTIESDHVVFWFLILISVVSMFL